MSQVRQRICTHDKRVSIVPIVSRRGDRGIEAPRLCHSVHCGHTSQAVRLPTSGQVSIGNEQWSRAQTVRSNSVSSRVMTPS